jgi:hemerythrin-like domain-containing protein
MGEQMADFTNRVSQTLHEEHRATSALLERLEQLIGNHRGSLPDVGDRAVAQLLSDLAIGVATEAHRHFDFEEQHLFAYLNTIGESRIGAHLTDEHSAMRPLGMRLSEMARNAAEKGFDEASWSEFRRLGGELCERLAAHIQKEEMALLPLCEDSMDAETETRLYQEYAENV